MKNYTFPQLLMASLHFVAPYLLAYFYYQSSDGDYTFYQTLMGSLVIFLVGFAFLFGPKTDRIKTGRSFQTKSGLQLDEYHDKETPAVEMSMVHMIIFFIHLSIPVIGAISWITSK